MTNSKVVVTVNGKTYPTCMFNKTCRESALKRVNDRDHGKKRLAKICISESTCNQQQWIPSRKEDIALVQEFMGRDFLRGEPTK